MTRLRPDHPRHGRFTALVTVVAVGLTAAGCASTSSLPGHRSAATVRMAGEDGPPADPRQLAVVRRWAAALQAGNIRGAAGYFHLPSEFDNGPGETLTINTAAQAEVVNATLPCGAEVISAFQRGPFIDVLFRLTARAGHGGGKRACGSGIGQTARTEFRVHDGQILAWVRAPSLPGDPGVPGSSGHGGRGKGGGGSGGGNTGSGSLPA